MMAPPEGTPILRMGKMYPERVCALCARHQSDHPDLEFVPGPAIRALLGKQIWFDTECGDDLLGNALLRSQSNNER